VVSQFITELSQPVSDLGQFVTQWGWYFCT